MPRLSIKELLIVVAFCAGVAACASQVGFGNGVFWTVVVASTVMSSFFVFAASTGGRQLAWLTPAPFVFCAIPMMFLSLALWFNAGLLFLFGVFCAVRPPIHVRTLTAVAMLCMLASLVFGVWQSSSRRQELIELRQKYPIVSLASRLRHETTPQQQPVSLSVQASNELAAIEQANLGGGGYEYELRAIHSRSAESFMKAEGFGVTRMIYPTLRSIRRPELRNIGFDEVAACPCEPEGTETSRRADAQSGALSRLHAASRDDFLNPDGFGGLIDPPKQVVGFVAHGFHDPPSVKRAAGESWQLERLELVSLLKFDEPRVYVLDRLPRMDQLAANDAPTRPLNEFESAALPQLKTQRDTVIQTGEAQIQMLGSLRAAQQCLACHAAQRGELLGAFSYVFSPAEAPAPAAATLPAPDIAAP